MIAQEIPEVRLGGLPQERVQPIVNRPQTRLSERIEEQIVDVPRSSKRGKISERNEEQIVTVPRSSKRGKISERNEEQIVNVPGSGGRISKRIAEQTVDVPVASWRATSSAAASTLEAAESPIQGVFRTFHRKKKSATARRQSTANMQSHCLPSTGVPMRSWSTRTSGVGASGPRIVSCTLGSWLIRMGPFSPLWCGGPRGSWTWAVGTAVADERRVR